MKKITQKPKRSPATLTNSVLIDTATLIANELTYTRLNARAQRVHIHTDKSIRESAGGGFHITRCPSCP